jgi:hypothetical protein
MTASGLKFLGAVYHIIGRDKFRQPVLLYDGDRLALLDMRSLVVGKLSWFHCTTITGTLRRGKGRSRNFFSQDVNFAMRFLPIIGGEKKCMTYKIL